MKAYISLDYLKTALRYKVAVLSARSPLVGGWLVCKPMTGAAA
jgi:hypothetical protein